MTRDTNSTPDNTIVSTTGSTFDSPDAHTTRVLLHCCCAPCTLVPLASLLEEGWQVSLYFYNPNIHPEEEYVKRLGILQEYAKERGMPLSVGVYDPEAWERNVGVHGGPYPLITGASDYTTMKTARTARCKACYHLRFEALATHGRATGEHALDTTLTISPYQATREAREVLTQHAAAQGLRALATDWRSFYAEATQRSRALGMYRQNYCGCHYSQQEAEIERQARKTAKQAGRA
ncbi:MAG: epoxyqueuosine reductase QueH [Coriobacteriales bacterium]|jgi:predicted adenine nucleotide alpha hydrolase (AANH) superfamily ATPase|nr:epoxyqueuosine reductase QueH [Coriobacteriales bacterium]